MTQTGKSTPALAIASLAAIVALCVSADALLPDAMRSSTSM
jgi:hypothetical protein